MIWGEATPARTPWQTQPVKETQSTWLREDEHHESQAGSQRPHPAHIEKELTPRHREASEARPDPSPRAQAVNNCRAMREGRWHRQSWGGVTRMARP